MRLQPLTSIKSTAQLIESYLSSSIVRPGLTSLMYKCKENLEGYASKDHPINRRTVFSNHFVNLGEVKVVGFDLDYTLVSYTVDLQDLIYTMARDALVNAYGYPADLKSFKFDPKFAIRGLSVDSRFGILSKLSHMQKVAVNRTYRGKNRLGAAEMELLYGETRHISQGSMSQMKPLNDLFSVAEACLIADTIELFQSRKESVGDNYEPYSIIDDVQSAIRDVHVNGAMQKSVIANPDQYIKRNPQLADMLTHLTSSGKKTFLCTNR